MEHPYPLIEFESELGEEGVIRVPEPLLHQFAAGGKVTVRLTKGIVSSSLRGRGVTEEEIEMISIRQLEQRENVVGFLRAEGELSTRRAFSRRAASLFKH